jgi:hypothetical protein
VDPFPRLPHQNPVCTSPSSVRVTCHFHFMLLDLIIRIIFRKTCANVVFSTTLLPRPTWAQVSSSATYSHMYWPFLLANLLFFCVFPLPRTAYR